MFGGIWLCLTSFFILDRRFSDLMFWHVGLHRFSDESYMDVIMIGIADGDLASGDLLKLMSIEVELEDLKEGIGIEISL